MGFGRGPLHSVTQATGTTAYYGVPIDKGVVGLQIAWLDAVSAATITLELTNFGAEDAPVADAGAAYEWKDSGQTITGPAGSAAGSTLIMYENVRALRARLKVVTTAATALAIYSGVATA